MRFLTVPHGRLAYVSVVDSTVNPSAIARPHQAARRSCPWPRSTSLRKLPRQADSPREAHRPVDVARGQDDWSTIVYLVAYGRLTKQKQYSSKPPEPSPGARKCSLSTMWLWPPTTGRQLPVAWMTLRSNGQQRDCPPTPSGSNTKSCPVNCIANEPPGTW